MRQVLIIPILILAALAVFSFFFMKPGITPQPREFFSGATPGLRDAQAYLLPVAAPAYAPIRDTTVADPVIDANAALLVHEGSGNILFEKNSTARVPIASLTKILTAVIITDLFDSREIVTVPSTSVRVDGLRQTLYRDERLAVGDLVSMMLIESSNDAAYTLAAYASDQGIDFVSEMNRKAAVLGMASCTFTDPAGLDDTAFCSAADLLRLVRFALRTAPQLWPIMTAPTLTVQSADGKFIHELKSTDELLGKMEGIIGGKTGFTDGALGCLILVVKLPEKSDTLISIVLGSRARFRDTETLVAWARSAYSWQ